ncbi:hypothetical protein TanjilG_20310 [Lupinus angustifolius]|uniref:BHLH domain-containing protein n=1 Tax=Lupinus angustifolius TaxID=3871 RepID=A0A1J7IST1_LUPAN|nr:PREDICTED: transcription factor bHLH137-like [Lupinus angustifolius]XP_019457886.1 PREDICTED: transcription factor bHLH137-like [Lupinus angustifolius]OIW18255.1 hypothetical protein TanjilG_20310 [Lupinus angustifolius]
MAAFSYQYHPFLVDPAFIPNTPIIMSSLTHQKHAHINTTLPSYQSHLLQANQETSCVDHSSKVSISDTEPSFVIKDNCSPQCSMVVDKVENGEQVNQKVAPMEKKRRIRNGSPLSVSQSKDSREGRNKKQKKNDDEVKEEDKPKKEKKVEKEGPEEPPKGYIHVRARRGQATDSHSLAERVRREKISERMNMLQKLVPGCDKVTGKALMLDEIINYVQSLQNQVEFLSMKLASVNPMFFNLAIDLDLDTPMVLPEKLNSIVSPTPPLSSIPQCSLNQSSHFADTTTIATNNNTGFLAANEYLLDYAFLQGQRSTFFSEYSGGQFWDVEDQRQKFLNPYGFGNDSCSLN